MHLQRFFLDDLVQLIPLLVDANDIALHLLDRHLQIHISPLQPLIIPPALVQLQYQLLHLSHILHQFLLNRLVYVLAISNRLQILPQLVQLPHSHMNLCVDFVQLLGH